MQEQSIMEIIKYIIGIFFIVLIVSIGMFCYQLQDINTFKQQVNYQIERRGGLTADAVQEINNYSNKSFGGKYRITSDKLNQKVNYGETINYTIKATIPCKLLPSIPDVVLNFKGNSVSQVR